jgi:hypothetical protein
MMRKWLEAHGQDAPGEHAPSHARAPR